MKKALLSLLFIAVIFSSKAQSYIGYTHDNYAGVQSVLFNPASIADSRFKTDINIFSISGLVGNDMYAVPLTDVFKKGYDFGKQSEKTLTNNNKAIINFDIMGPSFMFNIAPKHTIAVFTRVRSMTNIRGVNGELIDNLKIGLNETKFNFNAGNMNGVSNSWGELGISYAAVLYQKNQHFLKGGLTAKYLQGVINGYVSSENINVGYNIARDTSGRIDPFGSSFTSTGQLIVGTSQDFNGGNKFKFDVADSRGFGVDLGFVYEWRLDYEEYDLRKAKRADNNFRDLNKYKLRLGLSVTDIGSINYKKSVQDTYTNGISITKDLFDSKSTADLLKAIYTKTTVPVGSVKTSLPTAFHADLDWNVYGKLYLNLNGDLNMISEDKTNGYGIADCVTLTPRIEMRWFSFYIPISQMEYSGTLVGTGLRAGIFFIGSGSVLTNIVSKESRAVDFHFGVKIPVYQKKKKDRDADGVIDKEDACKNVSGPVENKGCPWLDTDGDGVLDKDDACLTVMGFVENKGCPWTDTDGDKILDKDDACPTVAGPVENKGCPWVDTDGDTILDKDDDCPTVAGPLENKGCPWLDTDGDKILDKDDACPTVAGPLENKGCPWLDADADGVLDKDDACPTTAGPKENKGCPWLDMDGDGVLDKDDDCPTAAGSVENKGCPLSDADGDSVLNKDDACPTIAGPAENKGCPWLDIDGDGVLDKDDACPTIMGTKENKGCPEVTKAVSEKLKVEAESISFVTRKAILSDKGGLTSKKLNSIKEILKNFPNAKFAVYGHTDNVGNPKSNKKLSEARAKVVMDALIAKGVNPENLTSEGFGDTKPIASNKTAAGRAKNRRTEIIYLGNL